MRHPEGVGRQTAAAVAAAAEVEADAVYSPHRPGVPRSPVGSPAPTAATPTRLDRLRRPGHPGSCPQLRPGRSSCRRDGARWRYDKSSRVPTSHVNYGAVLVCREVDELLSLSHVDDHQPRRKQLRLQRERRVKLKHMYLIRGSVAASALFLPIRRRI